MNDAEGVLSRNSPSLSSSKPPHWGKKCLHLSPAEGRVGKCQCHRAWERNELDSMRERKVPQVKKSFIKRQTNATLVVFVVFCLFFFSSPRSKDFWFKMWPEHYLQTEHTNRSQSVGGSTGNTGQCRSNRYGLSGSTSSQKAICALLRVYGLFYQQTR